MLAQSFKTAEELGLQQDEWSALTKVLVMLETGQIEHAPTVLDLRFDSAGFDRPTGRPEPKFFNMSFVTCETDCGTAGCIAGWARELAGKRLFDRMVPASLQTLFMMGPLAHPKIGDRTPETITPSEAAVALRSYLTTGRARWEEALS